MSIIDETTPQKAVMKVTKSHQSGVFFRKTGKRAPVISPNFHDATSVSDCPSHGSLGRTRQKLHPKVLLISVYWFVLLALQ